MLNLFLLASTALFADSDIGSLVHQPEWSPPWFTGSLLASSELVVPLGNFGAEPYFTYVNSPARYGNDWKADDKNFATIQQVNFQPYFWIGLTKWADIQLNPSWSWNYREGPARWVLNDCTAKLEFQLYRDQIPHKSWIPSMKLGIAETFPTGKYERLNPQKNFTDQGGAGAWTTTFQIVFGKILHIKEEHWLRFRLNLDYEISSPVHVNGLNAFGGGRGTRGRVSSVQQFTFDAALEYSLSRHWAFACDVMGIYGGSGHFTGIPGKKEDGTPAVNTLKASIQYSIAPAIEYNFNDDIGIVAGSWFTIAGKNSNKFYTGMIAINFYYE